MPYRNYRSYRARRLRTTEVMDDGPARIAGLDSDLDFNLSGKDQPDSPQSRPKWSPSPDDVMNVRSAGKWAGRFSDMFKYVWNTGKDAMIPVVGDVYTQFVEAYNAAEKAFEAFKAGREGYDYYKAKLNKLREQFPDAPAPHAPVPDAPPMYSESVGRKRRYTPDVDYVVPQRYDYGDRTARGPKVDYAIPQGYDYGDRTARGSGNRSGELPVPRARGSSRRKHDFTVNYEYD